MSNIINGDGGEEESIDTQHLVPSRRSFNRGFSSAISNKLAKIVSFKSHLNRVGAIGDEVPSAYNEADDEDDGEIKPYDIDMHSARNKKQQLALKIPTFHESWITPKNLIDAPDEIVTYICMFLPYTVRFELYLSSL
jgi:hypothetical protein